MAMTAVQNSPAINLLATGPGGPTSLNPVYSQCDPANGNFFTTTNRDLVTFYLYPASAAPAWLAGFGYNVGAVVNFAGDSASITNFTIATNVVTILASNSFTVGEQVTISGMGVATYLNGQTVTVTAASSTQFQFTFSHADVASTPDTGTASNTAGAFIALVANSNQKPHTAGVWAAYSGASSVTLYSAPDACTGRKSDVDNYNVPLGAGSVEFLVLPSSVFTQANGQFQFLASSNLVYVYVRNL